MRSIQVLLVELVCIVLLGCSTPYIEENENGEYGSESVPAQVDPAFWFKDIYEDLVSREVTVGQAANCQYVSEMIYRVWGISIPPISDMALFPANCEYLLKMIDTYVNKGTSIYGQSEFATQQLVDDVAVNRAVNTLFKSDAVFTVGGGDYYEGSATQLKMILKSIDGITWVRGILPSDTREDFIRDIAFDKSVYVAISNYGLFYSLDAFNWRKSMDITPNTWFLVQLKKGFLIYNRSGSVRDYYYFSDGINWTSYYMPINSNYSRRVVASPISGVCVMCWVDNYDSTNQVYYSTNGIIWTEATFPRTSTWGNIEWAANRFLVFTYNNNNNVSLYSINGSGWFTTSYNPGVSSQYRGLVYGNGILLAINAQVPAQYIYTTNGIDWTSYTFTNSDFRAPSRAYGNGKFVVAQGASVAYSTDGINWNNGILPGNPSIIATWTVLYGNGVFCILPNNSSSNYVYYYSSDGINWTVGYLPLDRGNVLVINRVLNSF